MSTEYCLDCETHNEAVHLTNNKLNPPNDSELVRLFLIYHRHNGRGRCKMVLESEHTIEFDNIARFKRTINNKPIPDIKRD